MVRSNKREKGLVNARISIVNKEKEMFASIQCWILSFIAFQSDNGSKYERIWLIEIQYL